MLPTFSVNKEREEILNVYIFKMLQGKNISTLSSDDLDLITSQALEKTNSNKVNIAEILDKESQLSRVQKKVTDKQIERAIKKDFSLSKYQNYQRARKRDEQSRFISLTDDKDIQDLMDNLFGVNEDFADLIQSKDYDYIYKAFYQFQLENWFRYKVDIEILLRRYLVDKSVKAFKKLAVVIPHMTSDIKDVLQYMLYDNDLLLGLKYEEHMKEYKKKARAYVYNNYNEISETIREELVQSLNDEVEQQEIELKEIQELNEYIEKL